MNISCRIANADTQCGRITNPPERVVLNMTKYILFIFIILVISSAFISCGASVHTYYFKDKDLKFKIIEKDTFHILVLDDNDSIYLPGGPSGQYMGLEFYIPEDSNIVYIELGSPIPIVYKFVENKYKIRLIQHDIYKDEGEWYDYSHKVYKYAVGNKYIDPYFEPKRYSKLVGELSLDGCWGFFGDSDQGRYTFGVMRGKKYYGVLEPLEWK